MTAACLTLHQFETLRRLDTCQVSNAIERFHARLRNEGAAISNLIRNIGAAIGISALVFLLTRNSQILHAALGEHVTLYGRALAGTDLGDTRSLLRLDRLLSDQGAMVAYIDDFRLMMILTLLTLPFVLLFRRVKP